MLREDRLIGSVEGGYVPKTCMRAYFLYGSFSSFNLDHLSFIYAFNTCCQLFLFS